jgi:hypothetical protein
VSDIPEPEPIGEHDEEEGRGSALDGFRTRSSSAVPPRSSRHGNR